MTHWRKGSTGERGQAAISLVIVLVVVAIAAVLLNRTAWTAESINKKAKTIAQTGGGINEATGAVIQLERTNSDASSINDTAKPLEGKLAEVIRLAQSIDGLAKSINGTANSIHGNAISINGTAGTVNGTAKGINGQATSILNEARRINDGVAQINTNLDTTLAIANGIKSDTGNILGQANTAHKEAACIDAGLPGGGGNDGHCR
jgi:uncharacterized protein YoxC